VSINSLIRKKMRRCESSEKSSGFDVFSGLGVGGVVEQDGAQDGLFRVEVRGQSGFEGQVGNRGHLKIELEANTVDRTSLKSSAECGINSRNLHLGRPLENCDLPRMKTSEGLMISPKTRKSDWGTGCKGRRSRFSSFGAGTLSPALRASDNPIAMACFLLVTFLPLRPLFNFPCFIARISLSTLLPAAGEYLRDDFTFGGGFFFGGGRHSILPADGFSNLSPLSLVFDGVQCLVAIEHTDCQVRQGLHAFSGFCRREAPTGCDLKHLSLYVTMAGSRIPVLPVACSSTTDRVLPELGPSDLGAASFGIGAGSGGLAGPGPERGRNHLRLGEDGGGIEDRDALGDFAVALDGDANAIIGEVDGLFARRRGAGS
jgi:hypothetical protein